MKGINLELQKYIEEQILPLYDNNIGGHGISHIKFVIERSFELINEFKLNLNLNMVYTIAVFHDIGYKINPDNHEAISAQIFLDDINMKRFFTDNEINLIAEAIIDHRASLEYEARSVYGKIVSSADREISVENMLKRSILFQKDKHKDECPTNMQIIDYSYKKLLSKYGKDGYAKMYFPDKKYLDYINKIQELLDNKNKFVETELKIIEELGLDTDNLKLIKT